MWNVKLTSMIGLALLALEMPAWGAATFKTTTTVESLEPTLLEETAVRLESTENAARLSQAKQGDTVQLMNELGAVVDRKVTAVVAEMIEEPIRAHLTPLSAQAAHAKEEAYNLIGQAERSLQGKLADIEFQFILQLNGAERILDEQVSALLQECSLAREPFAVSASGLIQEYYNSVERLSAMASFARGDAYLNAARELAILGAPVFSEIDIASYPINDYKTQLHFAKAELYKEAYAHATFAPPAPPTKASIVKKSEEQSDPQAAKARVKGALEKRGKLLHSGQKFLTAQVEAYKEKAAAAASAIESKMILAGYGTYVIKPAVSTQVCKVDVPEGQWITFAQEEKWEQPYVDGQRAAYYTAPADVARMLEQHTQVDLVLSAGDKTIGGGDDSTRRDDPGLRMLQELGLPLE